MLVLLCAWVVFVLGDPEVYVAHNAIFCHLIYVAECQSAYLRPAKMSAGRTAAPVRTDSNAASASAIDISPS